jgi:hypothetical protein
MCDRQVFFGTANVRQISATNTSLLSKNAQGAYWLPPVSFNDSFLAKVALYLAIYRTLTSYC